jgi:hypothetical protein
VNSAPGYVFGEQPCEDFGRIFSREGVESRRQPEKNVGEFALFLRFWDGGAEGVRTPDLLNAIQALYQLSYDPVQSEGNVRWHIGDCQNQIPMASPILAIVAATAITVYTKTLTPRIAQSVYEFDF